jgi:uncharacterized protein YjiS (DUF1127 family)
MVLLLAALLSATPAPCEALWPTVWKDYEARELKAEKLPVAKERLRRGWILECREFSRSTLDCARKVGVEAELADFRRSLRKELMPPNEIDELIAKVRRDWSILHCADVESALDRVVAALAGDVPDAGVPRSDAGVSRSDAGLPRSDAGLPRSDAEVPRSDAGVPRSDAGLSRSDAGLSRSDAGLPRSDAGVPRSDDCAGAELASGKCQCAHHQCMDLCCPEGWACAHSGASTAKCIRPR